MLVFACMTPLGVMLGTLVSYSVANNDNSLILALVDAITAGTFIYIACVEQDDIPEISESGRGSSWEIISLGLGITLMAVVAFWI